MSENYATVLSDPGIHNSKLMTCGKISVNHETKIVDGEGRCVPFDTPGELLIRGYGIFLEYKYQPELTLSMKTDDGWLKTG